MNTEYILNNEIRTKDELEDLLKSENMPCITKYFIDSFYKKNIIYFLLDEDNGEKGKIVYIGQTTNLYKRLSDHINPPKIHLKYKKDFNAVIYFLCDPNKIDEFEKILVTRFQPKYNISLRNEDIKKISKYMGAGNIYEKKRKDLIKIYNKIELSKDK